MNQGVSRVMQMIQTKGIATASGRHRFTISKEQRRACSGTAFARDIEIHDKHSGAEQKRNDFAQTHLTAFIEYLTAFVFNDCEADMSLTSKVRPSLQNSTYERHPPLCATSTFRQRGRAELPRKEGVPASASMSSRPPQPTTSTALFFLHPWYLARRTSTFKTRRIITANW
jgi:hypothetical protein